MPTANILKNSWQISKIPESSKVLVPCCLSSSSSKLTCILCIMTDNNNNQSVWFLTRSSVITTNSLSSFYLATGTLYNCFLGFWKRHKWKETYLFFSFCDITQYLMCWIEKEHLYLTTAAQPQNSFHCPLYCPPLSPEEVLNNLLKVWMNDYSSTNYDHGAFHSKHLKSHLFQRILGNFLF